MANTYLQRTQSGTETDSKKATISVWVKIGNHVGNFNAGIFGTYVSGNYNADGNTQVGFYNGGLYAWFKDGGSTYYKQESNKRFRDHNAWYHLVYRYDMTQSTASDRIRVYVNGQEITDWDSTNNPGSTQNIQMNNGGRIVRVGTYNFLNGTHNYFDGSMSHYYFCDGYSYAPTEFGETDSTTGEWKIKTQTNVNHGTNGFLILKDGNTITDQSANSNDLSLAAGTLTKTEDNPSNIFCTLNPLQEPYSGMAVTYSFGNTKYAGNSSDWQRAYGTIGANTGKFFYEFKVLNVSGTSDQLRIGWDSIDNINMGTDNYYSGLTIDTAGKLRGGEDGYNNYDPNATQMTAAHSGGNFSFTTGDILGMAIDIDNNTFSVYKNGNLEINAYSYASASNCSLLKSKGHFISPSVNWYSTSGNNNRSCFNFGNGYFETTAITSSGTNASGIGLFEYDVPTGYTAWATKGLNE